MLIVAALLSVAATESEAASTVSAVELPAHDPKASNMPSETVARTKFFIAIIKTVLNGSIIHFSLSSAQPMFRLRSAGTSLTCPVGNLPFLTNSTRTPNKSTAISNKAMVSSSNFMGSMSFCSANIGNVGEFFAISQFYFVTCGALSSLFNNVFN